MKTNTTIARAVIFGACTLAVCAGTLTAQTYVVRDMGTLGGPLSGGQAINGSGVAVGFAAQANADFRAIIPGTGSGQIPALFGDRQSHAFAINDSGQVAVMSYDLGEIVAHGLLWQNGATTNLGDFAPRGLNATGKVVGSHTRLIEGFGWVEVPAVWSNGVMTELPVLGGDSGSASAVDSAGRVAGWAWNARDATVHATLWQGGIGLDLGVLAGGVTGKSQAYAMNDSGTIIGWSTSAAGTPHACRFTVNAAGTVTSRVDLGVLTSVGARASYAFGINIAGDIVGTSGSRAVLWRAGAVTDLNSLIGSNSGWLLERAYGINAAGQIVGSGKINGMPHGFVLTIAPICAGDFNGDGLVNPDDLADFIGCYFAEAGAAGTCRGSDFNHDGIVNPDDLADYIGAYFGGCL